MREPFDETSGLDPLTRQAIGWLVRLRSGEATAADAVEFRQWRNESPAHEAALKRAVALWKSFETAAERLPDDVKNEPTSLTFLSRPATRRALIGGALAAGTAAYLLARPPLHMWPSLQELSADYRTGKGEQLKVALRPDVSLQLGAQTSIGVETSSDTTRVELIDGEAAVTTGVGSRGHFIILAAGALITANQADFDARCIDGVATVTCVSGSVSIERGGSKVDLGPGQRTKFTKATNAVLGSAEDVDLSKATAWRSGVLIFTDRPLGEVVEEINRYLPGHIFVTNAKLRSRIVNGTFHREQLDSFVGQVEQLFGAKATVLPGGVTLLS